MKLVPYYVGCGHFNEPQSGEKLACYGITFDLPASPAQVELLKTRIFTVVQKKAESDLAVLEPQLWWDELESRISLVVPVGTSHGQHKKAFAQFRAWVERFPADAFLQAEAERSETKARIRHIVRASMKD